MNEMKSVFSAFIKFQEKKIKNEAKKIIKHKIKYKTCISVEKKE